MDGFPNGRRLEDDVTRIELQAVAGVVLAAIGLWYDDYDTSASPVTTDLLDVLGYSTGVEENDTTFQTSFPYVQMPWSGRSNKCSGMLIDYTQPVILGPTVGVLGVNAPEVFVQNFPNPFTESTNFRYRVRSASQVTIRIYDLGGRLIKTLVDENQKPGEYTVNWKSGEVAKGVYTAKVTIGDSEQMVQSIKLIKE
jgi:hypothetical protein